MDFIHLWVGESKHGSSHSFVAIFDKSVDMTGQGKQILIENFYHISVAESFGFKIT